METLDDLVLESARLSVRLRNKIKEVARDPQARQYTYVLLLQNGNFYVGSTGNIYIRMVDHFFDTERSSLWVREHGPPIRIVEICRNSSPDDEERKTLEYMDMFGWEKVRGSHWCKVEPRCQPVKSREFVRGFAEDPEYVPRQEINEIMKVAVELWSSMI